MDLSCDICGNSPIRAQILIEGAKMLACSRCMKGGKVIHYFREGDDSSEPLRAMPAKPLPKNAATDEEIIENWGTAIRKARQKAGLTIEQLASRIMEKGNYMHAIESGRIMPTLETAKKIQKELKIILIEKPGSGPSTVTSVKNFKEPTLEDMLEQE
jgi:putative transcription factor